VILRPVKRVRTQLVESAAAFGSVFRNRGLRDLELGWAGSIVGHWAFTVAVSVFAYNAGGPSAVGLIFLLRMVPSALLSPFAAVLGDRYRRERVMFASDLVRAVLVGAAAVAVFAEAPAAMVYALTIGAAIAATPFRPALAAISPSLARTPEELSATNVVTSTIESVGYFGGPALAGLLLGVASTGTVFAVTAALHLWSAFFVGRIHADYVRRTEAWGGGRAILREALAGFRAGIEDARLRVILGLFWAQTLVAGAVQVLVVVTAIELLDLGRPGVGFLSSAFGVGAFVGAIASFALVGSRRLAPPFLAGMLLWGAPLALIGLWPNTAAAVVLLGLVGVANTLVDVSGFTLLQRTAPQEVLARVFGVLQMLWLSSLGIGAMLVTPLVHGLGGRGALVVTGAFLPVIVLLVSSRVMRIDAVAEPPSPDQLALLTSIPIFAPLPGATLEHVAGRLVPLRRDPGAEIVRAGKAGDLFYLVVEGEVEVQAPGRLPSVLGPGQYFGEIALLRDVPRTATVVARTPTVLYALGREDFLAAVTSHGPSAAAAEAVVDARLGRPRVEALEPS
jgi:Major Facilitator Superfamily/Cyclic nucleotide-binding domain